MSLVRRASVFRRALHWKLFSSHFNSCNLHVLMFLMIWRFNKQILSVFVSLDLTERLSSRKHHLTSLKWWLAVIWHVCYGWSKWIWFVRKRNVNSNRFVWIVVFMQEFKLTINKSKSGQQREHEVWARDRNTESNISWLSVLSFSRHRCVDRDAGTDSRVRHLE